ncbi:5-hydroxymethyluracil DNA glycosylase [Pseudonocardia sp. EC080610-09]|uniref:bifunctional DNA-formamidopyrimidine glycosylase/DNA-(apurinic or apyrimidinic site) lyase n=1 Tax=unclassified Pseudonocardia TaxID=2619320 RepID=UPI0006CAF951|nr:MULTISPECIES: bifunctional DNA-formamidopyrimidine glycosylase/DNA-(apurinic or apyrimidinic site) lyase [unclassified Pseudonocardia]ALE74527.1 5-hydroxymethyluracil DNA glycosylase [Pseudonocardia sp. EC080625-04]ALL77953.1 5-hydroxymethyluracil DNA glycosylase [Pseudonocardia sp. EC080610-09]ALL80865.1 5-hydroxymethyluracil DNA glycosylase [Pseudonocardia sp. EC080619-01]
MPELPEVEVVRRGLADHVLDRRVAAVEVLHPRAVRRHPTGSADFTARLTGRTLRAAARRGKYLWLELDTAEAGDDALLAHLGMSGQMLVENPAEPDEKHLRVRLRFDDDGPELRFVDQRTFGGLSVHPLAPASGGGLLPEPVAHIARDPMDPAFSADDTVAALRRRRTEVKRALLDQTVVSGIGNIYADEALWRARLHGLRPTEKLTRAQGHAVLDAATTVMTAALAQGGTSFDALYVNVNGASGYFDRSLNVYGQVDRACPRCGTPIRRDAFMNRSSFTCPRCQPRPRTPRT